MLDACDLVLATRTHPGGLCGKPPAEWMFSWLFGSKFAGAGRFYQKEQEEQIGKHGNAPARYVSKLWGGIPGAEPQNMGSLWFEGHGLQIGTWTRSNCT